MQKNINKKWYLRLSGFIFDSLGKKILFGFILSATIPLMISGFFTFYVSSNALLDKTLEALKVDVDQHIREIESTLSDLENDLIFLSSVPPIQGIIRASKNNGFDSVGNSTHDQWVVRLQSIFRDMALFNETYMQIRYIDEHGKELVRVNSSEGVQVIVSEENLSVKSDRYYFQETMKLNQGDVFVSPVDLNREGVNSEIEIPIKPTMRYATPVFDDSNNRKGIVITNIDAGIFLSDFRGAHLEGGIDEVDKGKFIVDQDGFFLVHTEKNKEWGGKRDLNTGHNITNGSLSEMSGIILSGGSDSLDMPEHNRTIAYSTVVLSSFNKESFLVVFELIPREVILVPILNLRNTLIAIGFLSLFFVGLLSYFISRKISGPIRKLYEGTRILEKGNLDYKVTINSNDEIGELGNSFNKMALSIKDYRDNIEKKVSSQTKNITEQKNKLEIQQMAILNILEDIQKEKSKVEFEEKKVRSILRNIGDGVFVVDNDRNIIVFNSQAEKISGFKESEVIGKKYDLILKFTDEKDKDKTNTTFVEDVMNTGKSQKMPPNTILTQRDKSTMPVSGAVSPLKDKNGKVVGSIVVFRDITMEKNIDTAKSEFISVASHQLRTPMTGIQWIIERFLKKEKNLSEEGREYLNDLHTSTVKLSELVDSLLNVSRIESSGGISVIVEKLDLVVFIEEYIKEIKPLLVKNNITLKFEEHPKSFEIVSDPKVLRNIIQSIMSNAIEYTPRDGSIEIIVEDNNDVMIKIRDTGIGIPKEAQFGMFEKFHRAENAKSIKTDGTGLGLYIAKKATEALGGKIGFISKVGKGTTFYIELPSESSSNTGGKKLL